MIAYRIDADFYGNSRKLVVAGEGFREGRMYADMVGIPTIGYGHALIAKGKKDGKDFYQPKGSESFGFFVEMSAPRFDWIVRCGSEIAAMGGSPTSILFAVGGSYSIEALLALVGND